MPLDIQDLVAVGLNHHTAPLEVRERVALDDAATKEHLRTLLNQGVCAEAFLVSTCNRVELFGVTETGSDQSVFDYFCAMRGASGIASHLFLRRGRDAVVHLFRVAASLDSLVVGEPQILGQIKSSVRLAEESESLGRLLRPLMRRTLSVAKRVRTETQIGQSTVGVGSAGVELSSQIFGDLRKRRAMLIGAGEMGLEVAKALQRSGLDELIVINRTFQNGVTLATEVGGTPVPFERMAEYLARVDIVLAATSAPNVILQVEMVRAALRKRKYKPLFLMDLSVPRNIDPRIDQLDAAYLFNVDDLSGLVEQGRNARKSAALGAQSMIEEEANRFLESMAAVELGPKITALSQRLETLRLQELEKSKRWIDGLSDAEKEGLETLTRSMMKKVLHGPVTSMREAGNAGDHDRIRTILNLWKEE